MNEQAALARVREYVREKYPVYPTEDLVAERFEIGWTIFPRPTSGDISTIRIGRTIFLIGDSGTIMEASSSLPPGPARSRIHPPTRQPMNSDRFRVCGGGKSKAAATAGWVVRWGWSSCFAVLGVWGRM